MSILYYKKQIVLFLVLFLLAVISFSLFSLIVNEPGFTNLLPTNSMMLQATFIFILIPLASIIGGVFTGYVLGPLFLFIYKKTIGMRMEFGIQTRNKPNTFKQTWKGVFPALMAINFALMIGTSEFGVGLIVSPDYLATSEELAPLIGFLVSLPLMCGISIGLFSPVWFLLDAGIVFTNKNRVKDKIDPIEVRSIGGWYHYLLKGYAGIGVIISYVLYVINILGEFNNPLDGGFISAAVSLWIMPVLISIFYLPTLIILDMNLASRQRFILKFAKRLGIEGPLEDPLNIHLE